MLLRLGACKKAGVQVVMMTGHQFDTAAAIATYAGLHPSGFVVQVTMRRQMSFLKAQRRRMG
jgi:magnesium-transporting ATPase (P-type)